ncbi:uncharacterized protein LOC143550603 [Bidens hawaiensis]|uniref:uncharacterized protein LOC143550603 n=1 Tax=Bidens hawaiensis TaxID=980011 RepID=UPI00404ADFA4
MVKMVTELKSSIEEMKTMTLGSNDCLSNIFKRFAKPANYTESLDEFVNDTEISHIGEVEAITTAKKVVICGSIIPASNYIRWYYIACKVCATTLTMENKESHEGEIVGETSLNQFKGKYKCRSMKCNGSIVNAVARYRVPFDVQDSTGSILALTLWEGQALPKYKNF